MSGDEKAPTDPAGAGEAADAPEMPHAPTPGPPAVEARPAPPPPATATDAPAATDEPADEPPDAGEPAGVADLPLADRPALSDDPELPPAPELELEPDAAARRNLLYFIIGGAALAVVLLIVAVVLLVSGSGDSVSSAPPTTASNSSAVLTLTPSGSIKPGTTVTARINLSSTSTFQSAVILLDGAPVAQAAAVTDPMTFTPTPGRHSAVAKVTLTSGEEVTSPPIEFTVAASAGTSTTAAPSSPSSTTATSVAPSTTAAPTGGPLQPNGLSADGAKPLKFGDPVDRAATTFPGEQSASTCAPISPTYSGGRTFTFFGFPGGTFSYFLTQDPELSTVEGAKVGMTVDELQALMPGLESKTNAAGVALLVNKSADGSSELVFYVADGKVLFIAGSVGDRAESKQC